MTDQDKIEKAREALKAIKNGVNLASYVRCSPHEWPKGDELAKVMWSLLEANESLHEIVEMLDAAPVSGGEEQAALDALEWFITELKDQWDSCDLTDADVSRFERNAKTIRKALQSRPEVVTVEEYELMWQEAYNKSRGANVFNDIPAFKKCLTDALTARGCMKIVAEKAGQK